MKTASKAFVFAFATTLSTALMECNRSSFEADHSEELEVILDFPGERQENMEVCLALFETHHRRPSLRFW